MTEIERWQTGLNLKEIILDILAKYGIHPKNIYSITSDSGSNLLKAIKLIDRENGTLEEDDDDDDSDELADDVAQIDWNQDDNSLGIIGINLNGIYCVSKRLSIM